MRGRPRLYDFASLRRPGDRLVIVAAPGRDPADLANSLNRCAYNYARDHDAAFVYRVRRKGRTVTVERLAATGEPRIILNARATLADPRDVNELSPAEFRIWQRSNRLLAAYEGKSA